MNVWISDVAFQNRNAGVDFGTGSEIDAQHMAAASHRAGQDHEPSAGRTAQVDNSISFPSQFESCEQFLQLKGGARWQTQVARLAKEMIPMLIARHLELLSSRSLVSQRCIANGTLS